MPSELETAAETVVRRCLAIAPGENALVIGDPGTAEIAEALRAEAERAGADAVLAMMSRREENGSEPPPAIAAALSAADVYLAPTSKSLSHTAARKAATDRGIRGATMPGVTADALARLMSGDFDAMRARSRALAALLSDAGEAQVTCPRGTDLRLDLSGRAALSDDGDLAAPGAFGNLPCGEAFIAPLNGDGVAMVSGFDGAVAAEAEALTIRDGSLVEAHGPNATALYERLSAHGPAGLNLAELGVGTNDRATLTGNVLEDEKILGTIHIAFGASAAIGGTVSVPIHQDVVVLDATLDVGDTRVLDAGRWVLG